MKKNLPLVFAALLMLLFTYALRQFDKNYHPEKYIFEYETLVPSGGVDCDPDLLATILTWGDNMGEKNRSRIYISDKIVEEHGPNVLEYVGQEYSILHDSRADKLQDILYEMTPYLADPTADYRIYLLNTRMVNAFTAIGNNVFFTTGLYELAENDDERAMVIGHELGHQDNGHVYEVWQRIERWRRWLTITIFGKKIDLSKYAEFIGVIEDILSTPLRPAR